MFLSDLPESSSYLYRLLSWWLGLSTSYTPWVRHVVPLSSNYPFTCLGVHGYPVIIFKTMTTVISETFSPLWLTLTFSYSPLLPTFWRILTSLCFWMSESFESFVSYTIWLSLDVIWCGINLKILDLCHFRNFVGLLVLYNGDPLWVSFQSFRE